MKKKSALILGLILLLVGGVAYAELPPRVSWTPGQLKPVSIAPGGSASYNFTLTHTGILPVLFTHQLRVVAEGSIVPYVTITQPKFPSVFKKGNQATLSVKVMVSTTTPLSVKDGQLVLKRFITVKVGKGTKEIVTDVWRADALPVELTFSTIPLPADPGEAGKATLAGIDADRDGVRDDMQRQIVFLFPDSEKKRAGLMEETRRNQTFLLGNYPAGETGKLQSWTNFVAVGKSQTCSNLLFGVGIDSTSTYEQLEAVHTLRRNFAALFQNTPDRARKFNDALGHIGGKALPNISSNETQERQECTDVGINPDAFSN